MRNDRVGEVPRRASSGPLLEDQEPSLAKKIEGSYCYSAERHNYEIIDENGGYRTHDVVQENGT